MDLTTFGKRWIKLPVVFSLSDRYTVSGNDKCHVKTNSVWLIFIAKQTLSV